MLKNTPSREKAFKARLNTLAERKALDWWEKFFERIVLSDFLRKSVQERSCFTLDWLLNENNLVKVLEGKYDNRSRADPPPNDKPLLSFADILAKHGNSPNVIEAEYTLIEDGGNFDRKRPLALL